MTAEPNMSIRRFCSPIISSDPFFYSGDVFKIWNPLHLCIKLIDPQLFTQVMMILALVTTLLGLAGIGAFLLWYNRDTIF